MVYFQIKYKAIKIIKKELYNSSTLFVDFVYVCVCESGKGKQALKNYFCVESR